MGEFDAKAPVRRRASRRSGKGPTVADVAREAGVSPMTVSRVVNKEANVVDATREKVEAAIARIGYVPNAAARALAGAHQCRIALVHDNPSAAWLSALLVGCLAQASQSNAQLLVENCDDPQDPERLASRFAAARIDGVILPPPLGDDQRLLEALGKAGIPFAQVASGNPSPSADNAGIDEREAARTMTRYLLDKGHRRIGFIRGNAKHTAAELRQAGYEAALEQAGIACDPALIADGDFSYRSSLDAADRLLGLDAPPTAIFASNDDMAAAAVAVAHRRGLDVPGDVAVCGFDDTAIATMIWPQLTTVRQPVDAMARTATRMVIDAVRAERAQRAHTARHEVLDFELIERESA